MSKIDNKSIQEMETEISNTEKSLEKMRKTLEEMKKKNIPELIVGEKYQICNGLSVGKKVIILDNKNQKIVGMGIDSDANVYRMNLDKSYFDYVDAIHLDSSEDKIIAKFFINLYNNRS